MKSDLPFKNNYTLYPPPLAGGDEGEGDCIK